MKLLELGKGRSFETHRRLGQSRESSSALDVPVRQEQICCANYSVDLTEYLSDDVVNIYELNCVLSNLLKNTSISPTARL